MNYAQLLKDIRLFVPQVGREILNYYRDRETLPVTTKANHTPLTKADLAAHQLIEEKLKKLTPNIPFLSEESREIPFEIRRQWDCYWLVDPLDGTKEFLEGNGEFAVNISLILNHRCVLGVIYQPTTEDCFYAADGLGAYWHTMEGKEIKLHTRKYNEESVEVLISRHHTPKWLTEQLENSELNFHFHGVGSSLKFCRLAAGVADVYPRMGPTSEWDTAAGQCILEEAGGAILDLSGKPLQYNTKDNLDNPPFLAVADSQSNWTLWLEWLNERTKQK